MPEITAAKNRFSSRNRVAHALLVAAKGFVISAAKTFHALWLETTGLLFAAFTVLGAGDLIRHYRADHLADHKRAIIVSVTTLVCGWFTVFSFAKAKRTRK